MGIVRRLCNEEIEMLQDTYRPMVSQETILEMAQEKVLEDADLFTDWLTA
jgi:hypothetical protein